MNEVRSKFEGIIWVEENKQKVAKSATIAVAQNNIVNSPSKYQEMRKKLEHKQQRFGGRSDQKKRPSEFQRSDYQCNLSKIFNP